MERALGVVVGTGIGGQRDIAKALIDEGFEVKTVQTMWPRDHYVYFNGRYVKNASAGSIVGNPFAEGGEVLTGTDFLLVSDLAYLNRSISGRLSKEPTYGQIKEAIASEGRAHHPEARIHIAPTGYFHGGKGHVHIDMFTLLLPKKRILMLDTFYGKGAGRANEYDAIAESEGLTLMRYDGSQDGVWYPLNAPVLPTERGEIVVVDEKARSLTTILRDAGVPTLGVEMPQHTYPAGKIRCQTNTYRIGDSPELLLSGM